MGISSSKSSNAPLFKSQVEGAGNTLTGAYNTNAPQIQKATDSITGLLPGMIDQYKAGDAGLNAARDYNVGVLSGNYLNDGNPYLDQVISDTGDDTRNQLQASLGARGLTGGSGYADLISRNIAKMASGLRYQDYGAERDRMATAAGQSPGIAGADAARIAPILGVADQAQAPVRAAAGYSSALGGLLGQYQTVKQKQAWGPILAQMASNAAAAYAGGG